MLALAVHADCGSDGEIAPGRLAFVAAPFCPWAHRHYHHLIGRTNFVAYVELAEPSEAKPQFDLLAQRAVVSDVPKLPFYLALLMSF